MCYQNCQYENWHGECTARQGTIRPCEFEDDESYEQALEDRLDEEADFRYEEWRDRQIMGEWPND